MSNLRNSGTGTNSALANFIGIVTIKAEFGPVTEFLFYVL
jgi:hypothetical protein